MYLKKLELNGFKSFAKTAILEFPSRITAIVGPNGSGKSNIAEAVRWVLGEQSIKSLRGKKGEDLIWNGSPQLPRSGKASAVLIFDNKDGKIPLEFEEVSLARKIFRDGLNEYYLNNSQVRLKDVVELMARLGLGESKHNIIGQGEVDRILLSSARERREMLEEALGLRVYQLKKNESERKLDATANNMKQVEMILREIGPHLKFLRAQSKKAEARGEVEKELRQFQKIYFAKEKKELLQDMEKISAASAPVVQKQKEAGLEINKLRQEIESLEKNLIRAGSPGEEEKKFAILETRRRKLERELGRLEGRLELEKERASRPQIRVVDLRYIKDEVREFLAEVKDILESEERIEEVRAHLLVLVEDMEKLLGQIERGTVENKKEEGDREEVRKIEATVKELEKEIKELGREAEKFVQSRQMERGRTRELEMKIRKTDNKLRYVEEEERGISLALERFKFDEERLKAREEIFLRDLEESGLPQTELSEILLDGYENTAPEEIRKKIERLRGKLEEIGGIDPKVVREYEETESRHEFLNKELEDLKQAEISLKELIKELDRHIKNDFRAGFAKIKEEFHNYFRIIFGGGRASLQLIQIPLRGAGGEEGLEENEKEISEEGLEISIDLPKKRIKSLAMLSGGERALTSIALLFAITAVNPPPFLILDETDAALDEANSQRYAAILKELSKKTQLILVTHNRETMKCAGILYGVTMGDDGVSKLLSLKLEEAEMYTSR